MNQVPIPEEVAMLRLSAMGDAVNAFACLAAIRQHAPACRIAWMLDHNLHPLFSACDHIDFVLVKKERLFSRVVAGHQHLKKRWPVLLNMHSSWRANGLSTLWHSPRRIGFDRDRAQECQRWFCNESIEAGRRQHVVDGFLSFAKTLGVPNPQARWPLPIEDYEEAYAGKADAFKLKRDSIVISPCASSAVREWSLERYARLMALLDRHLGEVEFVITGAPQARQRAQCSALAERCAKLNVHNLAGLLDLKQLAWVLHQARLVIAPDSGPAHLANALGTRVVGLYASMNPLRTGPYHSLPWVVNRYPQALMTFMGKKPESVPFDTRIHDARCMELVDVEDVYQACIGALDLA